MHLLSENSNLVLSVAGLTCSAAGSLIEKLAPEHRRGVRAALVSLAIAGFVVTALGTVKENADSLTQKQQIGSLMEAAQSAEEPSAQEIDTRLNQIQTELSERQHARAEWRQLAATANADHQEYFVQLAEGSSPQAMEAYAAKLQKAYNVSDRFTGIVTLPSGANRYRLAFGQHLNQATAQRYLRIANNLELCPDDQIASIEAQPK